MLTAGRPLPQRKHKSKRTTLAPPKRETPTDTELQAANYRANNAELALFFAYHAFQSIEHMTHTGIGKSGKIGTSEFDWMDVVHTVDFIGRICRRMIDVTKATVPESLLEYRGERVDR
jgi:hypothetical protein